ncbi:hypothetical protein P886_3333 [Alteromonadaceae bacterium 2753L.S.0a.02]|nr:hypothetical protein P886_3333 [Alteromonadaceae bacterium 2753L.S.0a.02]
MRIQFNKDEIVSTSNNGLTSASSPFALLLGRDPANYIPLDTDTTGASGRAVYIDQTFVYRFGDAQTNQTTLILSRLKQLRAKAGGATEFSNKHNAFEHKSIIGNAFVKYKIFPSTGDPNYGPGVYITDLEVAKYSDGQPGLYHTEFSRGFWRLSDKKTKTISTHHAAINGLCKSIDEAATSIMPSLLDKAYGHKKWKGDLKNEGYTLCFNPPSLYDKGTEWRTPRQKSFSQSLAAQKLSKAFLDAQEKNKDVQWVIHGDGAYLLDKALNLTGGRSLNKHTIIFLSPTKNIASILPKVRKSNINLHDDVMKIHDDDIKSLRAQLGSPLALRSELLKFPGMEDQADLLGKQRFDNTLRMGGYIKAAASLGSGIGAFLLSPAAPTLLTLAGIGAGAYATWESAKTWRNIAANKSTNPGINPHMHPYKNRDEMNLHAKKYAGGQLKTFAVVLKELFRR